VRWPLLRLAYYRKAEERAADTLSRQPAGVGLAELLPGRLAGGIWAGVCGLPGGSRLDAGTLRICSDASTLAGLLAQIPAGELIDTVKAK
jgi:hypothetical protein